MQKVAPREALAVHSRGDAPPAHESVHSSAQSMQWTGLRGMEHVENPTAVCRPMNELRPWSDCGGTVGVAILGCE